MKHSVEQKSRKQRKTTLKRHAKFCMKILLDSLAKRKVKSAYLMKNISACIEKAEAYGHLVSKEKDQLRIARHFIIKSPKTAKLTADELYWIFLKAFPVKYKSIRNQILNRLYRYKTSHTKNWRIYPEIDGIFNVQSPNVKEHVDYLIRYFESMKNLV